MSHFDHKANEWDTPGKIQMMQVLASAAKKQLNLSEKLDIMDFGCGTGLFGLEFADHAKRLVGVDVSQGMLDVFNQKAKAYDFISTVNVDLEKDNLNDTFDLIVTSMAFHHLDDPKVILQKLSGMLNENGMIVVVDLDTEDGTFHPDSAAMGVKHFGFSAEEVSRWCEGTPLRCRHEIIHTIEKNDKRYAQFMAVFQ